jgi:hypothetical protein
MRALPKSSVCVKSFPFSNDFHRVALDPAMTVALRPPAEILADIFASRSFPSASKTPQTGETQSNW